MSGVPHDLAPHQIPADVKEIARAAYEHWLRSPLAEGTIESAIAIGIMRDRAARAKPVVSPTPAQAEALMFIKGYVAAHGIAPSLKEIAAGVGLVSRSSAKRVVDALEERGHIKRLPFQARAIALVEVPA